ncbi:SHOCT domain-containing protein [Streptomyces sp. CAU 1734]|uniref:SHOCT domain-containing protein n=1 Tax=Streptomyces sp. CAU 1734 TaxID=3140360 RepID=UPI0032617404
MHTLAHGYGHGPGPWIVLLPLIWATAVAGAVTLLRRGGVRPGRRDARRTPAGHPGRDRLGENSPIALLGRRFAAGEIEEDEYWRRLSVLDEQFGRIGGPGPG